MIDQARAEAIVIFNDTSGRNARTSSILRTCRTQTLSQIEHDDRTADSDLNTQFRLNAALTPFVQNKAE